MKGKALIEHMQNEHHWVTWNPPAPNTREYKKWKHSHETEYHGRWQDQQDHDHRVER